MGQKSLEERLGLRIVGREHDENQHDRVDEHTVGVERAQCLRQDGERGGGDERAPDVAEPAEHHEHQHEDGEVEVELRGLERRIVQAEERACRARTGCGGDELRPPLGALLGFSLGCKLWAVKSYRKSS